MNAIEIKGVKKKYGKEYVLNGIDLVVPTHSICGFIGKNGAGKTTLMRILSSLQKANEGKITIFGQDITNNKESIGSLSIAALIESPALYSEMNAKKIWCNNLKFAVKKILIELMNCLIWLD